MFSLDDINLQYPHALVERVPVSKKAPSSIDETSELIGYLPGWNIVYAAVVPLIILTIWLAVSRSSIHKTHVTILGLVISIALTIVLTDIVKNAVGRPRPDLIARCKPKKDTSKNTLVTIGVCTETDPHTLQDGWRSFPSGHSSFAFSGLGYLAVYIPATVPSIHPAKNLQVPRWSDACLQTTDRPGQSVASPGAIGRCCIDSNISM